MKYPNFFDTIDSIKLKDPLSQTLGTFEDGIIEFNYLDIVKNTGHSCPTVAGAYIMCLVGLKQLYKNKLPTRGDIEVLFKENKKDGTTGIVSNVVSHITGAADSSGFKGINSKFCRNNLINFNADITSSIKFRRKDTNRSIELIYDPSVILLDPRQKEIMIKVISNKASLEDQKLWQKRVEEIFKNIEKTITVINPRP